MVVKKRKNRAGALEPNGAMNSLAGNLRVETGRNLKQQQRRRIGATSPTRARNKANKGGVLSPRASKKRKELRLNLSAAGSREVGLVQSPKPQHGGKQAKKKAVKKKAKKRPSTATVKRNPATVGQRPGTAKAKKKTAKKIKSTPAPKSTKPTSTIESTKTKAPKSKATSEKESAKTLQQRIDKSIKDNLQLLAQDSVVAETQSQEYMNIPREELQRMYVLLKQKFEKTKSKLDDTTAECKTLRVDVQRLKKHSSQLEKDHRRLQVEYNHLVSAHNQISGKAGKQYSSIKIKKKKSPLLKNVVMCSFKQSKLIHEFYQTERDYVDSLVIIQKRYMEPIKRENLMNEASFRSIFGQVQVIVQINQMFLTKLDEVMKNSQETVTWAQFELFCEAIQEVVQSFRLYVPYVSSYEGAVVAYRGSKKNKALQAFLRRTTQDLKMAKKRSNTLLAYLVKPIQRIPRYRLLLEGLVKATKKEKNSKKAAPLLKRLEDNLTSIRDIADHVNKKNGEIESHLKMIELKDIIPYPNLIIPSRRFIKQAEFFWRIKKNGHSKRGTTYLFNDLLIFCAQGKSFFGKTKYYHILFTPTTRCSSRPHVQEQHEGKLICLKNDQGELQLFSEEEGQQEGTSLILKTIIANSEVVGAR